jgi:hypothetical protein
MIEPISVVVPVRIESEMNKREHWTKRKKRFDTQRFLVRVGIAGAKKDPRWGFTDQPPYVVTMTRIAPRPLDSDNLASGFKAVRDEIAQILKLDDGDPRIDWVYAQARGRTKEYAIRVRIEQKIVVPEKEIPF